MFDVSGIEKALRKGCKLHSFRSGGGLRVFRLEKNGKLQGYGEHPDAREALVHLNEDYLAGGRPYKKVYGGKYPHYMTGSSTPTTELDAWLLRGANFDAHFEGQYVAILQGYGEQTTPDEIHKRAQTGESVTWTDPRGITYCTSACRFPNGEVGSSTKVVDNPKDLRPWMWRESRTGKGNTLWEALDAAFAATPEDLE